MCRICLPVAKYNFAMQNPIEQRYSSNSSTRVLSFPEKTAEAGGALTSSQIAETVQMTLPTAYRLLYTFQAIDLIEKEPDPKVYGISPRVLRLGYGAFKSSMLWNYAHPHLVRASQECGETSNLAVPEKVMSFMRLTGPAIIAKLEKRR